MFLFGVGELCDVVDDLVFGSDFEFIDCICVVLDVFWMGNLELMGEVVVLGLCLVMELLLLDGLVMIEDLLSG